MQLSRCAAGNPASGDPEDDTGLEADSQFFAPLALSELSFLLFLCRISPAIDLRMKTGCFHPVLLLRKEVIQPHLPIRLPCYDFTPVIDLTLAGWPLAVTSPVSGAINSHGVTGGVYKARERIHRGMLIRDY